MRLRPVVLSTVIVASAAWWLTSAASQERRGESDSATNSPGESETSVASLSPTEKEIRIARLIRQLGAESFPDRSDASRQLAAIGLDCRKALEAAVNSGDAEVRLQAETLLKKFKAEDLWLAGHVSCHGRGQPASKTIAALADQTGNRLLVGLPYGTFHDAPLDLDFPSGDFWPVLDDVCRQTDNHVRTDIEGRQRGLVVVGGAAGRFPTAYSGPLRAQITEEQRVFSERIQFGEESRERLHTFELDMSVSWEDRLKLVAYRVQPEVSEAMIEGGQRLASLQAGGGRWCVLGNGERQLTATLKLAPPPTAAKRLDRLAVKWTLMAVGDPATLVIDDLPSRQPRRQGDVELAIERCERHENDRVEIITLVTRDGPMPDPPEALFQEYTIELFDSEGRACRLQSQANALVNGGAQFHLIFCGDFEQATPKALRLTYPQIRDQREMPLVFRNVPLPVARPE
jgi:hypothetical protein